jgi:hypothetical protein
LIAGDDELAEWAKQRQADFFLPEDEATITALAVVSAWVADEERLTQAARATFLGRADLLRAVTAIQS